MGMLFVYTSWQPECQNITLHYLYYNYYITCIGYTLAHHTCVLLSASCISEQCTKLHSDCRSYSTAQSQSIGPSCAQSVVVIGLKVTEKPITIIMYRLNPASSCVTGYNRSRGSHHSHHSHSHHPRVKTLG